MTQLSRHLIDLVCGCPHPSLLPTHLLSAAAEAVLADPSTYSVALQYGSDPGFQPLREALATWLHRHYQVERDPERLCISGGASQNVARILQSFTDPNVTKTIWLAAPTYHLVSAIFDDAGFHGRLRAFPEDEDGPDVEELSAMFCSLEQERENLQAHQAAVKDLGPHRKVYKHIIYVVPTCSNPSGKTMPTRRREDLIRLARKHDALIVSDDVYDFLQWPIAMPAATRCDRIEPDALPEMILPRLCDIDLAMGPHANDPGGFGNAVSNGSFSKLVGPGLRTGWLEGSRAFAFGLSQTGSTKSGGSPSQFCAAMMAEMVSGGALQEYIATTVRPALRHRHNIAVQAIEHHLYPLGVEFRRAGAVGGTVYGGYFIWLTLPEGLSAMAMASACRNEKLVVGDGNMFQVHGDEGRVNLDGHLRLTFAYVPEEDIVRGVIRLSHVLRGLLKRLEFQSANNTSS